MLTAYIITKDVDKKPTKGIELYGELEDLSNTLDVSLDHIPIEDGIYNCKVIYNDDEYLSTLYLWLDKDLDWHGIIVKKNDVDVKEARDYYEYHRRVDNYTAEEMNKICPHSTYGEICENKSEHECRVCDWWNNVWHP